MSTQIVYDVKELLEKLDTKLDTVIQTLAQKADLATITALELRVAALEKRVTGWQAVLAFVLLLVAVGVPTGLHFFR